MFSFLSALGGGNKISKPTLSKPTVHAIEEKPEKRARTLKHLIKASKNGRIVHRQNSVEAHVDTP
jgi:hypothetical protein